MAANARPKVPGVLWRTGIGVPSPLLGGENECYRDLVTGLDYQKILGSWGQIFQPTLAASKITGQLVDSQVHDVAAGKITGTLSTGQLPTIPSTQISGLPVWTYGTAFPGSPSDGDKHTLVDSTSAPTYQWTFRYNAGSGFSQKWEFVGGTTVVVRDTSGLNRQNSVANTFQFITGQPSFTLPRAGYYSYEWGGIIELTNPTDQVFLDVGRTDNTGLMGSPPFKYQSVSGAMYDTEMAADSDARQGITRAAGDTIGLIMNTVVTPTNVVCILGWIRIQPVRCA